MPKRPKDDIRVVVARAAARALSAAVSIAEDPRAPAAVRVQAVTAIVRAAEQHLAGGYRVEVAKVEAEARKESAPTSGDILDLFGGP